MSLLGFDALGRLALGQLPQAQAPLPFGKWEQPLVLTKSAASLAAISKGFVAPPKVTTSVFSTFSQPMAVRPPQATQPTVIPQSTVAATPTPTALVFSAFPASATQRITSQDKHTSPVFRVLRPDAATPTALVFTKFSEPQFSRTYPNHLHPEPRFRILRPDAATTGPLVFTKFSEPSFSKVRPQSNTNSSFFVVPPVSAVVAGGDFEDFGSLKSKPVPQYGFTNAPIVLPTQPTVFSKFSEPSKTTVKNSEVANVPVFITPAVATVVTGGDFSEVDLVQTKYTIDRNFSNFLFVPPVQPYVFSTFNQPYPKKVPQDSQVLFIGDRGPAQTPIWSNFPQFKELLSKKPQQDPSIGFIGDLGPAKTPDRLAFADFEGIPSKRPLEGYITQASPPAIQNFVFSKFDQPVVKRILQPDGSFVNFPVVVAAVQPYVFSDFGQPQQTKRPIIDDRSFLNFPVVVVQQQPYIFSPFEQPRPTRPVSFAGFTNNTPEFVQAVIQNYTFGSFSQPQLIRPRVDGFTNTPDFLAIQPYVFTSFDQPKQSKLIVPGFTNNLAFIAPQVYVFSRFEQPFARKALQIDSVQFVDNTPAVIVLTPDFSFTDFGLPFYGKQTGISFTNSPLQPIIAPDNSAPFAGFATFVLQLPAQSHIEQHPGIAYQILVPEVLAEDVISGKWWKSKARDIPPVIPVSSSTISEVAYDKDSNELNVKFHSGRIYNYSNVDNKKVKGLLRAKSSGKYLHNNIKGKYFTTRMK